MANTSSAKKAVRSSERKRQHNLFWKKKIKDNVKALQKSLGIKEPKVEALNEQLHALQKNVDKAAKEKVIHKNKANRLKSRYAKRISALFEGKASKKKA